MTREGTESADGEDGEEDEEDEEDEDGDEDYDDYDDYDSGNDVYKKRSQNISHHWQKKNENKIAETLRKMRGYKGKSTSDHLGGDKESPP